MRGKKVRSGSKACSCWDSSPGFFGHNEGSQPLDDTNISQALLTHFLKQPDQKVNAPYHSIDVQHFYCALQQTRDIGPIQPQKHYGLLNRPND
ncbi:hypothetical protein FGO68_gene14698 [Halteria grandinella]|uniref:Uncharacterized protein n=1 Tax=Halteria grandinella TaxID=5974 RepID=A0A8J8NIY3_HALGN|nr:hypothetical protein FGO68_gene14698 [Halteria grandinella]